MTLEGRLTGAPASEGEISASEHDLGIRFPPDYRTFLQAAGGKSKQKLWRGLWPVADLVSLNRTMPLFQWFGGLIGIGNEGFIVYALDFRNVFPVPVTVGLSSSDWEDVTPLADSFAEWLEETLP